MKPKIKYRVARHLRDWGIQVQVKPRGKWYWLADEDGVTRTWVCEAPAKLACFVAEQGPAYARWFDSAYGEITD